ncbi:MAG: FKBP-type peptidyl-prolyl cis-trans isomerase [Bacteroidetes bacterium]|nr:FKBP-type peptidyl-prolyl cis-trans isomerase [Bacteroidota bacterium]MBI3481930.1 FKBP-type peptidyl-prolyl cis-trans isomerase [Bacteroidota bacterium]
MKNSILVFLVALVLLAGCNNDRETVSGQKFTMIKKGDGKEVDAKKFLILNFMFKDGKDSIWNDTRKNPYPWITMKQAIQRPGDNVLEVIGMLTKGDSTVFKVSAKDIFKKSFRQAVPPNVDSTSFFTFHVGLADVLDSVQFVKYRDELVAKQNEKMLNQQKDQLAKDTVAIDNYLKAKNIVAKKTSSGLRYVITRSGLGNNATDGQTVKVNYAGYLLNGKYFDTSLESVAKEKNLYQPGRPYTPYDVVVGQSQVIQGWHLALKLMNKGSKMTVYIPSSLAYGNQKRSEDIVENSILAFDMEIVDIK